MKNLYILTLLLLLLLFSCNSSESKEDIILKKIKQKIDQSSLGTTKIKEISTPEKINDSTFKVAHVFDNNFVNKEMKITNIYIFNKTLDSILSNESYKIEMKSEGDWINVNL